MGDLKPFRCRVCLAQFDRIHDFIKFDACQTKMPTERLQVLQWVDGGENYAWVLYDEMVRLPDDGPRLGVV